MHWTTGWIWLSVLVAIYAIWLDRDFLGSYSGGDYALIGICSLCGPIFWLLLGVGHIYQAFSYWMRSRA